MPCHRRKGKRELRRAYKNTSVAIVLQQQDLSFSGKTHWQTFNVPVATSALYNQPQHFTAGGNVCIVPPQVMHFNPPECRKCQCLIYNAALIIQVE